METQHADVVKYKICRVWRITIVLGQLLPLFLEILVFPVGSGSQQVIVG